MKTYFIIMLMGVSMIACASDKEMTNENENPEINQHTKAAVTEVSVTGQENAYTFSVTIQSPDTGCDQYADWWEVITPDGSLLYRRILAHSHVNEQPFTRSGGGVPISKDQEVYVRVHMNTSGYSEKIFKGTVDSGFNAFELESKFDAELSKMEPLPTGCAF